MKSAEYLGCTVPDIAACHSDVLGHIAAGYDIDNPYITLPTCVRFSICSHFVIF